MAQNKFRDFLQGRQWSEKVREFVDYAPGDMGLPDATSWEQREDHLTGQDVTEEVLSAAKNVLDIYRAHLSWRASCIGKFMRFYRVGVES